MKARSINKLLNRGDYFDVDTASYSVPSKIVDLYNAPFNMDNLHKLFSKWVQQQPQDVEEDDDYIFVDRGGKQQNKISWDESETFFSLVNTYGEEFRFDAFPERINSFVNFCEIAGVDLYWKSWVTEKYF